MDAAYPSSQYSSYTMPLDGANACLGPSCASAEPSYTNAVPCIGGTFPEGCAPTTVGGSPSLPRRPLQRWAAVLVDPSPAAGHAEPTPARAPTDELHHPSPRAKATSKNPDAGVKTVRSADEHDGTKTKEGNKLTRIDIEVSPSTDSAGI